MLNPTVLKAFTTFAPGADAMATTEKDAVNLPEMPEEMPIYYLRIAMEIDREEEFAERLGLG